MINSKFVSNCLYTNAVCAPDIVTKITIHLNHICRLSLRYISCLQDPHRKDALYDMLRISRGLMNSTVKYLLKASTNYSCKGIVRKVQNTVH